LGEEEPSLTLQKDEELPLDLDLPGWKVFKRKKGEKERKVFPTKGAGRKGGNS